MRGMRGVAALLGITLQVGALYSQQDLVGIAAEFEVSTPVGSRGTKSAVDEAQIRGKGWSIEGSLFYAQERMDGTDFARRVQSFGNQKTNSWIKNGFSLDFGGEVSLAYRTGYDGWEVAADYLHFASSKSTSVSTNGSNVFLVPTQATEAITQPFFDFERAKCASSSLSTALNLFDVQVRRGFFTSKTFALNFGIGAQYLIGSEDQEISYDSPFGVGFPFDSHAVKVDANSSFEGVGPIVSMNSQWWMGKHWYLYGLGDFAAPYGVSKVQQKQSYTLNDAFIKESATLRNVKPNVRLQLGFGVSGDVHQNKARLSAELGYDLHYFFNQHEVYVIDNFSEQNVHRDNFDISLHGITFNFKWSF